MDYESFSSNSEKQPFLPLIDQPNYSSEKWIVADCNQIATQWVMNWKNWISPKFACVYGPHGSGKTHLASIFREITHGVMLTAKDAISSPRAIIAHHSHVQAFALDNIFQFPESWIFEFYNMLRERDYHLLITTLRPPSSYHFQIKDVASRLRSIPLFQLNNPDDVLFEKVLAKQLHDRGICINTKDITYLAQHIPRSFESIRLWTDQLDYYSLSFKKKISRALIYHLLAISEDPETLPSYS